jgi:hypothetical protein
MGSGASGTRGTILPINSAGLYSFEDEEDEEEDNEGGTLFIRVAEIELVVPRAAAIPVIDDTYVSVVIRRPSLLDSFRGYLFACSVGSIAYMEQRTKHLIVPFSFSTEQLETNLDTYLWALLDSQCIDNEARMNSTTAGFIILEVLRRHRIKSRAINETKLTKLIEAAIAEVRATMLDIITIEDVKETLKDLCSLMLEECDGFLI